MIDVIVYTDGGCSGNPGPGGWAYVILSQGNVIAKSSGGDQATTNNRMELTAVTKALEMCSTLDCGSITVNTDSQYVRGGITAWINNWKRNGWRTAGKDPVKNKEYWIALDEINARLNVTWNWVKGHAGIEYNELCDSMVREEMDKFLS